MADRDDRAWLATRKGLFELRRGAASAAGGGWSVARTRFLGEPVSALLPPDENGRMLAALNLGHFGVKLHASDDAGANWHEVSTPAYPAQPAGSAGPAWTLVQVWTLEAARGTVWAGTLPGGVFRSADFGQSWQLVESLWHQSGRSEWFGGGFDVPGVHSISPHPQHAGELMLGISCGGAWHTNDDGVSWAARTNGMHAPYMPPERAQDANVQDPHRIVRCRARPEVLWCQHHSGIWRSVDNGLQWQAIEAPVSSFGFAVAAHPSEPDTAWFVPAEADQRRVPVGAALVVNRTRDGGRSFETLRQGLPQSEAYDLVHRHGLDVAANGRSLMFGSSTGNLWASDDAGDSWQAVSAHLPPIHALRFG